MCAAPAYLQQHGVPQTPDDLLQHQCLQFRFPSGVVFPWQFVDDGKQISLSTRGRLILDDLAAGNDHFFAATGITQGNFLQGVRYTGNGAITHSLVTRSRSGTWRTIEAHHRWDKLMTYSQVEYR